MENLIFNLYQRLGEHFTGNHKKQPLYLFLLIIFIFLNFLSYHYQFEVNTKTLYWVFSSIVQALLALVALMGVVSIFKLQNLHSHEERILDETNDLTRNYFTLLSNRYSTISTLNTAIAKYVSSHSLGETHLMSVMKKRIDDLLLSKELIADYAIKSAIYTFTVVLVSLLFLIFSQQISALYLGANSLYLIFILSSYSLFLTIKGLTYSIKD